MLNSGHPSAPPCMPRPFELHCVPLIPHQMSCRIRLATLVRNESFAFAAVISLSRPRSLVVCANPDTARANGYPRPFDLRLLFGREAFASSASLNASSTRCGPRVCADLPHGTAQHERL